jgi:NIMA (never in mitosis gene a)-related kinase
MQNRVKKAQTIKSRIPEEEIWRVAYNALEGLNKLHEANIIHRDIKPANIFFHKGLAKLGDLNVAKHLIDQFTVTQTGTPYYASPEVWN